MGHGKSGNKASLKAALQSQQSRLQKKQKVAQAAQVAEQKQKGRKGGQFKGKEKAPPPPVIIPFRPTDRILLIGEGNFSFARALISCPPTDLEHLPAKNVTATAYDSEEDCFAKYPDAEEIVNKLRDKGAEILFGVDALKLEKISSLKGRKWDRIVWNFPHAGKGITDQDRNILSNQMLILGFLRSAANCLTRGPIPSLTPRRRKRKSEDHEMSDNDDSDIEDSLSIHEAVKTRGTLLITLRNVAPYTLWNVPRLAKNPPPPTSANTEPSPRYTILRSFVFHRHAWKDYEHRMTKGERAQGQGKTGEGGEDRTWEFCLKDEL